MPQYGEAILRNGVERDSFGTEHMSGEHVFETEHPRNSELVNEMGGFNSLPGPACMRNRGWNGRHATGGNAQVHSGTACLWRAQLLCQQSHLMSRKWALQKTKHGRQMWPAKYYLLAEWGEDMGDH